MRERIRRWFVRTWLVYASYGFGWRKTTRKIHDLPETEEVTDGVRASD